MRSLARARGLDRRLDTRIVEPRLTDQDGNAALVRALVARQIDVHVVSPQEGVGWSRVATRRFALVRQDVEA